MTIEEYFGDWAEILDIKEADRIIRKLSASNVVICPGIKDIFKAFALCSFKSLRVLVLSQDPYPSLRPAGSSTVTTATGIAFANSPDTPISQYSPSLEVLKDSVIDFTLPHSCITFDPSLEKWEEQGVLMLNAALSCEVNKPQSHELLWRPFVKRMILNLSKKTTGIVYVLLGNTAQSFEHYIDHSTNHVLKERHPSWYARNSIPMPPDIWKKVNDILIGQNGYGIEWYNELKL